LQRTPFGSIAGNGQGKLVTAGSQKGDGLDGQIHPLLRGKPGNHDGPTPAGGPSVLSAVHRHRVNVSGLDESPSSVLYPTGQLTRDRGDDFGALKDRTGEC